uniref:Uncharacterized protein n=1 Tax=Oryctolagus cuniculus TaxID=9986 RepID=G1U530_RABIT
MAILQTEAEKAELQVEELEVQRWTCERGSGPWYQYMTAEALTDHSPKAAPDNGSFLSPRCILFSGK